VAVPAGFLLLIFRRVERWELAALRAIRDLSHPRRAGFQWPSFGKSALNEAPHQERAIEEDRNDGIKCQHNHQFDRGQKALLLK
jgi:hypothetical protein